MKVGLKTIPLPVDDDDRLKLVEDEYGVKGWAVVVKLWQYIAAHGFYLKWDIDAQFLFMREGQLKTVGQSFVSEVVACCIRRGVFSQEKYEKYEILTSRWLQETFLNATRRNKEVIIDERYALPIVYEFIENVNESGKNANISLKNADIFQQKKRKEKKGKENNISPYIPQGIEEEKKGDILGYDAVLTALKEECPVIYERHEVKVNGGRFDCATKVISLLDEIGMRYTLEELRAIFRKATKTFAVQPKYANCDFVWLLNNIERIKTEPEEQPARGSPDQIGKDGFTDEQRLRREELRKIYGE